MSPKRSSIREKTKLPHQAETLAHDLFLQLLLTLNNTPRLFLFFLPLSSFSEFLSMSPRSPPLCNSPNTKTSPWIFFFFFLEPLQFSINGTRAAQTCVNNTQQRGKVNACFPPSSHRKSNEKQHTTFPIFSSAGTDSRKTYAP